MKLSLGKKYRFWKKLGIILGILTIIYFLGPRPSKPKLDASLPKVGSNLLALEKEINKIEKSQESIKEDNQARIVWHNKEKKKTKYSVVYLHGFSSSQAEAYPIHREFAKRYGCNLYLSRLAQHGKDTAEVFLNLTADELLESAKRAIAIGKRIGKKVIVIATSTGATMALYLASQGIEFEGLILYSPLIDFYSSALWILDKPWGLQIARLVQWDRYAHYQNPTKQTKRYWTQKFRLEGAVTLKNLVASSMLKENFQKVKKPVFLGYYYKDKDNQDNVVSVARMLDMYENLGTDKKLKRKKAFPKAGHHVIGSKYTSRDVKSVKKETFQFAEEILKLEVVNP